MARAKPFHLRTQVLAYTTLLGVVGGLLALGLQPWLVVLAAFGLCLLYRVARCDEEARLLRFSEGSDFCGDRLVTPLDAEMASERLVELREADDPLVREFLRRFRGEPWLLGSRGLYDILRLATTDRWLAAEPSRAVGIARSLQGEELFARMLLAAPDDDGHAVRREAGHEPRTPRQAHVQARRAVQQLVEDPACWAGIEAWRQGQRDACAAAQQALARPDGDTWKFAAWGAAIGGFFIAGSQAQPSLALAFGPHGGLQVARLVSDAPVFFGALSSAYVASGPGPRLLLGLLPAALAGWGLFRFHGIDRAWMPGGAPAPLNERLMFAVVAALPAFFLVVPPQTEAGARAEVCRIMQGSFTAAAAEGDAARRTASSVYRQTCLDADPQRVHRIAAAPENAATTGGLDFEATLRELAARSRARTEADLRDARQMQGQGTPP